MQGRHDSLFLNCGFNSLLFRASKNLFLFWFTSILGLILMYVCFMHCAIRLRKLGTMVPRIELVEIRPSMDLVHRCHQLPNEDVRKYAMKFSDVKTRKKVMYNLKYKPQYALSHQGLRGCLLW